MPVWLRILSVVLMLSVVVGAHVYLYKRLIAAVTPRRWVRWAAGAVLAGLTVGGVLARTLFRGGTEAWVLSFGLPLWVGLFLYLLLALVLIDVVLLALRARGKRPLPASPERREFLARAAAAGAVAASGGLAGFGVFRAYQAPEVSEVPLRLPGLPKALEGFTLVQLTDVHVGAIIQRAFLDDLVARANALKPDLVAITGDLVDGTPERLGGDVARLRGLRSRHGTFFVTGNHDHYSGANAWVAALRGMDMTVLRNQRVEIGDAAASFDLLGVDDWGGLNWRNGYDLEAAAQGRDPARASVLLAHQPSNFDAVAALGIGLQLSGHTHGGQMFPGPLVAQLLWQGRHVGLTTVGASKLYVSRGNGFVGPPMRVGSPPEIVKVVLLPG